MSACLVSEHVGSETLALVFRKIWHREWWTGSHWKSTFAALGISPFS